jgi:large subunit ribosomal protein L30
LPKIYFVMAKIKVTQVRSLIDRPKSQKLTMQALGLNKIGKSVEIESNNAIDGMIRKINHLVKVENC